MSDLPLRRRCVDGRVKPGQDGKGSNSIRAIIPKICPPSVLTYMPFSGGSRRQERAPAIIEARPDVERSFGD